MTEKQEKIISTALRLFAQDGYDITPTSKVAREAQVSEGLIFRHFENKEGLLNAIIASGLERANSYFAQIIAVDDPEARIRAALTLPFSINKEEHEFWKLMYTLKWQKGTYDTSGFDLMKSSLTEAFSALGYAHPETEARFIEVLIDGIATEVLLKEHDPGNLLEIILSKYNLNPIQ